MCTGEQISVTAGSSSVRFKKPPVAEAALINEAHLNIVTWYCDVTMTKCGDKTAMEQADTPAKLVTIDWPMAKKSGQFVNQLVK